MAILTAEYQTALDEAIRHLLARGSGTAVKRVSYTGGTTSRESELDNMTVGQLKAHIAWLERKVGGKRACGPLYP